jgi:hypothetical protein
MSSQMKDPAFSSRAIGIGVCNDGRNNSHCRRRSHRRSGNVQ